VNGVEHLNERFVEYQQWPNHLPDKRLKAVEGCEFIHYFADENQWTDWGHELGILSRHKCLGITYLLRRRVGRIPSVRRGRRALDQGRDARFIGTASELLRIRIESRHA